MTKRSGRLWSTEGGKSIKRLNFDSDTLTNLARLLSEWLAWRAEELEDLKAERVDMGLPEELEEVVPAGEDREPARVVEEIKEEIVDETEEIIS